MRHIAYAHLLLSLRELADLCERYNWLTSPGEYKTDAEHQRDDAIARDVYARLRPYLLLGIVGEWASGRLHISPRATSDAA